MHRGARFLSLLVVAITLVALAAPATAGGAKDAASTIGVRGTQADNSDLDGAGPARRQPAVQRPALGGVGDPRVQQQHLHLLRV
ncbi:hypothetical protein ACFL6C_09905 [Myxococcota bacterium]